MIRFGLLFSLILHGLLFWGVAVYQGSGLVNAADGQIIQVRLLSGQAGRAGSEFFPAGIADPGLPEQNLAQDHPEPVELESVPFDSVQSEPDTREPVNRAESRPPVQPPVQASAAGLEPGEPWPGGSGSVAELDHDYELGQADGPGLINFVQPSYPPEARRQGLEGRVRVRVLVGEDGRAIEVQVLEASNNVFIDPARTSALRSRYRPLQVDGRPRQAWVRFTLSFNLT